jgi:hypothetical protein
MSVDNSTSELESFDDDVVTSVEPMPEDHSNFVLLEKDVELIQTIADNRSIPYETALNAVLRDALDLYHWHFKRVF